MEIKEYGKVLRLVAGDTNNWPKGLRFKTRSESNQIFTFMHNTLEGDKHIIVLSTEIDTGMGVIYVQTTTLDHETFTHIFQCIDIPEIFAQDVLVITDTEGKFCEQLAAQNILYTEDEMLDTLAEYYYKSVVEQDDIYDTLYQHIRNGGPGLMPEDAYIEWLNSEETAIEMAWQYIYQYFENN